MCAGNVYRKLVVYCPGTNPLAFYMCSRINSCQMNVLLFYAAPEFSVHSSLLDIDVLEMWTAHGVLHLWTS
jgi:hypothetical protein